MVHSVLILVNSFLERKIMKASYFAVQVLSVGTILAALSGCATEPTRPGVPSNALQVSSGGRVVAFTAPHDGKAYLNDDTDKCVVYSTNLQRDQIMRFEPDADAVQIDGKTAPEGIANPGHDHSIYFSRSDQPDRADQLSSSNSNNNAESSNGPTTIPTVRVPIGIQVDVQPQQPAAK
jgi:hypothetical protein